MKLIKSILLGSAFSIVMASCQDDLLSREYKGCQAFSETVPDHPMKDSIQFIIDKYISNGIPGVEIVIKNSYGWLYLSGGYAKVESRDPFVSCGTDWIFSITKTYTAVLVMKEIEKGAISPDDHIDAYLSQDILSNITNSDKISVRMLLNHTSGILNVTELPEFMVGQLNDPMHQPSIHKKIGMMHGLPLAFEPGSDFLYSNTNYLLLQLILEKVSGKDYQHLLSEEILHPLNLQNTFYSVSEQLIADGSFPNYYFDRYANDQLENITAWNNALANASDAYGGIAASPKDVILFYESLVMGNIISEESLQEMQNWVSGKNSTEPEYGEGFEYWQFKEGSTPQFGHEGDGIGCSTQIFYVPDNNTLLYININVGRQLFGPYLFKVTDMKRELCRYVANW